MIEPYFERVAAHATAEEHLVDVRRARRDFHEATGKVEEDEPWFEQRMTLFVEWYVLDRIGPDGLLPAERFVIEHASALEESELAVYRGLTATQRTLVQIERLHSGRAELLDMIGGGEWSVRLGEPMVGLQKGDLLDLRIVPFGDELVLGQAMIFHPRVAREAIQEILERAHAWGYLTFDLVDLLASQRLRFDRYRNVKVKHVYRAPRHWSPV